MRFAEGGIICSCVGFLKLGTNMVITVLAILLFFPFPELLQKYITRPK